MKSLIELPSPKDLLCLNVIWPSKTPSLNVLKVFPAGNNSNHKVKLIMLYFADINIFQPKTCIVLRFMTNLCFWNWITLLVWGPCIGHQLCNRIRLAISADSSMKIKNLIHNRTITKRFLCFDFKCLIYHLNRWQKLVLLLFF